MIRDASPQDSGTQTSLRRRILIVVLAIGFLPSVATLIIATFSAIGAIRSYLIEQSKNALYAQAEQFGAELERAAKSLEALAASEEFARGVEAIIARSYNSPDSIVPAKIIPRELLSKLSNRQVYLFGASGLRGLIANDQFDPHPESVPTGLLERMRKLAMSKELERVSAFDTPQEAESGNLIWVVGRVRPSTSLPDSSYWIVHAIDPREVLTSLGGEGDMVLLSSRSGTWGSSAVAELIAEATLNKPDVFRLSAGTIEANSPEPRVFTYARIGVFNNMSRAAGDEASLLILQQVVLESATVALLYQAWQIALYGMLFVGAVGALGMWLSSRLVDPIMKLRDGFLQLESGDLDYRVSLRTGDELEELGRSMNKMAGTLQETYRNLASKLLELDEKAKELSTTYEIAKVINRSLNLPNLLRDITTEIRQLVECDQLALCLFREDDPRSLEVACTWPDKGAAWCPGEIIHLSDSIAARCLESGNTEAFRIKRPGTTADEIRLQASAAETLCVVPLRTKTGNVGVLLLTDTIHHAFRDEEVQILRQLSESLATAVEHGRLYEKQSRFAEELERQVEERTRALQAAHRQLVQTEKLAIAGELAANVAHEINNPLSIIKNYLTLLQDALLSPKPSSQDSEVVRDGTRIIGEEIDRIARIVDQLKKINAPVSHDIGMVEVNREITQLVELFRQTFYQKHLRVETDLDPQLGGALLCNDYLRQILMNLLRNAHDATNAGGTITIISRAQTPDKGLFAIRIRDTGCGIPKDNLNKIFDPFFTTKKDGKGTGLGLSVSYGLSRNMGGQLQVVSPVADKQGTEFSLILPIANANADPDETGYPVRRVGKKIMVG